MPDEKATTQAQSLALSFHALKTEHERLREIQRLIWALNDGNPPPDPIAKNLNHRIQAVQTARHNIARQYEADFAREFGPLR